MLLVPVLGRPALRDDDVPVLGPRSHKAWGLLAYLVANGPVPRDRLVPLLFPDAEDGRAALRWNLAHLRRVLGRPQALQGDPVLAALGPEVRVDAHLLAVAPWYELLDRVDIGAPLLEGLAFPSCPGFALWLEGERRRMDGLGAAALREAARAETAEGRPQQAAAHARRLVELQPWDEDGHELLVRALAQSGQVPAARAHVRFVTDLFLAELGTPPSGALAAAAEPALARPAVASRARTTAQLQAGTTAVSAGAAESGVESLRRAVAGARVLGDAELLVAALTGLGSAQVHAVHGTDESGAAALREAVAVAERVRRPELATVACRELGYVEFLRCRVEAAERWPDRAAATV